MRALPHPAPTDPAQLAPAERAALGEHEVSLSEARAEERRLDRVGAWIAHGRTVTFLGALALFLATWLGRLPRWGNAGGLVAFAGYVAFAIWHGRVLSRQEREKVRQSLAERGVARVTGRWHEFPERGDRHLRPEHPYAADLDVFGQGSLFQLMDETGTRLGEDVLASWLSRPAPAAAIGQRQGAVQELARNLRFRQSLIAECRLAAKDKADPARFIAWAEGGPYLESVRWTRPLAWALPLVMAALYAAGAVGLIDRALWWLALFAVVLVLVVSRRTFTRFYEKLTAGEAGFVRYGSAFAVVEAHAFEHPYLKHLAHGLEAEGPKVSERLHHFERLLSFAELRRNQLHPLVSALTLWDVHVMFRLERWRALEGKRVRAWFDALAELEALGSLAALAHDRPRFTYPELAEGGPTFVARGLGHPLLDHPVANDVALAEPRSALLITGSNMSGKTTLVRAIGANAVLALAGGPVCAEALRLSELSVFTSMRVKDSLERGVSYFYAEVLRLKAALDAATAARGRALFLLDEVLLGTNTRERQIASRRVLELLLETGAVGAVTTHDLALAALAEDPRFRVRNVHFRDALVDGRMSFDYRLRDGVVDTTNALEVLRQAGIPVEKGA